MTKDPNTGEEIHSWDKIIGVDVWGVETSGSVSEAIRHWNVQIHRRLKEYVQGRLAEEGKKPGFKASMLTFLLSAVRHGFYPFYYVHFLCGGMLLEVTKDFYRARYLLSAIPEPIRAVSGYVMRWGALNYIGVFFGAAELEKGMKFSNSTYWCVPAILVLTLIVFKAFGVVAFAQKLEKLHASGAAKKVEQITEKVESPSEKETTTSKENVLNKVKVSKRNEVTLRKRSSARRGLFAGNSWG